MARVLVVINPSAQDFAARDRWPEMRARLQLGGELDVVETVPDEAKTRFSVGHALGAGPSRVVAIGGDGTVHLVVDAMMRLAKSPRPSLAVIPFGTANDVAKSLGLEGRDDATLAQIAVAGRQGRLDVGHVEAGAEGAVRSSFFVDSITVGMDADVLMARGRYRDLGGYAAYVAAIAERAVAQQSLDARITVDGEVIDGRVFNVIVNNVPVYAGELTMPGSRLDDGLLDVYLFNRREYASKLMSFAIKQVDLLALGVHELLEDLTENQRTYRGRDVKIRLASPRQLQVDGEVFGVADEIRCEIAGQLDVALPSVNEL